LEETRTFLYSLSLLCLDECEEYQFFHSGFDPTLSCRAFVLFIVLIIILLLAVTETALRVHNKMGLREIGYEDVDWIQHAQYMVQ
jgi:hypothetical protein